MFDLWNWSFCVLLSCVTFQVITTWSWCPYFKSSEVTQDFRTTTMKPFATRAHPQQSAHHVTIQLRWTLSHKRKKSHRKGLNTFQALLYKSQNSSLESVNREPESCGIIVVVVDVVPLKMATFATPSAPVTIPKAIPVKWVCPKL